MTNTANGNQPTNSYLQHLVATDQLQDVVAEQDIVNQFGVLLIKKGARISAGVSSTLQQHKLRHRLEHSIELTKTLSNRGIYRHLQALLEANDEYRQLHEVCRFEARLEKLVLANPLHKVLRQHLTIMQQQAPHEFEHSLFCGWASALIGHEMGLTGERCENLFYCGLLHDIGLLHITRAEDGKLAPEQWRSLQSHVMVGSLIVQNCECFPNEVAEGIAEHHERLDRTGYPSQKPGNQLGLFGQIVGATDLLDKLCSRDPEHCSKPLTASLAYFRVHQGAFQEPIFSAIFRILSRSRYQPPELEGDDLIRLQQRVQKLQPIQKKLSRPLEPLSSLGSSFRSQVSGEAIVLMSIAITETLSRAGMDNEHYAQWLQGEMNSSDSSALIEADAMQFELLWLFKRLGWSIQQLLISDSAPSGALRERLEEYTRQIQNALNNSWPLYQEQELPEEADKQSA